LLYPVELRVCIKDLRRFTFVFDNRFDNRYH
jgi:hypothetical protein